MTVTTKIENSSKSQHIYFLNKRQRIPKGQAKMDNPEKPAIWCTRPRKTNKNTTQYVLETNMCKQTQIT